MKYLTNPRSDDQVIGVGCKDLWKFGILQRLCSVTPCQRDDFELVNMSPVSENSFFLKSVQS